LSFVTIISNIVIKPGPAFRVDPRPGDWTSLGKAEDRYEQKPGRPAGLTRDLDDSAKPG
jgi:hypothetical protein